ncbi:MAG TPA: oxygenase MpaB family protein [Solirubrobacteraceae bacterium]|nr:oxygenase MpaB family protein [Solirubrobacteraceae bacterium]
MGDTGALPGAMRHLGDPSADAVVRELARTQQIRGVSRVLRHLVENDQPVPTDLPASLARWFETSGAVPSWVDPDRLERGCTVVVEHGPQVCVALATASLVYCYAGYPGVKVLTFSRRLDHDAVRRVGETAQFVLAVMAPGSLHPGGRAIRKVQKVRLLHAALRHLVSTSGRWDAETDGVPICQEDLAGTLMSFSWIVVDALRKLGVRVGEQQAEDYHYRWRAIGEMLGVDPRIIPVDLTGARELTGAIARRNHRRSDEGIEMTRALFELHANSLPSGFGGAAPALTRYLLGDEVCALVDLPRTRWDTGLCWQAGVGRALDRVQSARGPVGSLTKMVGAGMLNQRVIEMAGGRSASFSIPVPSELQRRWAASGIFPSIDQELIQLARAESA